MRLLKERIKEIRDNTRALKELTSCVKKWETKDGQYHKAQERKLDEIISLLKKK